MLKRQLPKVAFVYRHIRLDTEETFYIGIGSELNHTRAYDKTERSKFWQAIVAKSGFRYEILFDNVSWEQACRKEIRLIKLFGRRDLGAGCLCNMTYGGEGAYGRVVSEETRQKRREQYKRTPIWGPHRKHHTDEAKKKISEAAKKSNATRDKVQMSLKISQSLKGKPNSARKANLAKGPLTQARQVIDTITGEVYPSMAHAARAVGIPARYIQRQLTGKRRNKTTFKLL